MVDKFTRTITTTEVNVVKEDGTTTVIIFSGDLGAGKAAKLLRKEHPELGKFTVNSVSSKSTLYELSIDDFMKYAKRAEPKT